MCTAVVLAITDSGGAPQKLAVEIGAVVVPGSALSILTTGTAVFLSIGIWFTAYLAPENQMSYDVQNALAKQPTEVSVGCLLV